MLLQDYAPGATPEELSKIGDEIEDAMTTAYHCESLTAAKVWAEDKILRKYKRYKGYIRCYNVKGMGI